MIMQWRFSRISGISVILMMLISLLSGCLGYGIYADPPPYQNTELMDSKTSITITDSLGNTKSFPRPVRRIICQNADSAEMLIAIGAGDLVVGVAQSMLAKPELMAHLPNAQSIGDWQMPDAEKLASLKPDVIISYTSSKPKNLDNMIQSANLTIIYLDCYKIDQLASDARVLGRITGRDETAENYAGEIEGYLGLVDKKLEADLIIPDNGFVEGYTEITAYSRGSLGDMIAKRLKFRNIAGNFSTQWTRVNAEWVIDQNPDFILMVTTPSDEKYPTLKAAHSHIIRRQGFDRISAVKNHRVYIINGDLISSPRGVIGLLYIAKALYPGRFSDIDPDEELKQYSARYYPGCEWNETFYPHSLA